MFKTVSLLTGALLLATGAAWAQSPGAAVAPVTSPQSTGATVQGTSSAPSPTTPTKTKDEKKNEKKTETKDTKK